MAVCLAAFSAGFLALETALLVFNDTVFRSSFYVFDPDMGFRVRPYAAYGNQRANEFGFNDHDYSHNRRPGTYRILFLGDSFNWMGGQSENYTAILESLFIPEFGPGVVEIISSGYSQTHTGEQLALLRKFGLRYQPDLVVLGFFAGNDFFDADPNRVRIVVGGAMTDIFLDRDFYTVILGQPLVLRSRLFLYLAELWTTYRKSVAYREQAGAEHSVGLAGFLPIHPNRASHSLRRVAGDQLTPDYLNSLWHRTQFFNPARYPAYESNVRFIESTLREMENLLRGKGIELLVSVLPDEVQVDDRVRDAFVRHYGFDTTNWDWNRPQLLMKRFCEGLSIDCFDLLPAFRSLTEKGSSLYLSNNGHWNQKGNRLAAELFYSRLIIRVRNALKAQ